MKKSFKVGVVAILFMGLVIWNYSYKSALDSYFISFNQTTSKIKDLKDNLLLLNYSIQESVLFQHYNNDIVNSRYQDTQTLLHSFDFSQKNYAASARQLEEIETDLQNKKALLDDLMVLNAKIKNSMTFLSSQIYRLNEYDREFSHDVMELINYFFTVKNTLDFSHQTNIELFENIQQYHFEESEKKEFQKLLQIHTNLLLHEFPYYIETIEKLTAKDELAKIDMLLQTYIDESMQVRKSFNLQILLIVLSSLASLFVILYFIFLSEREKQKILQLQQEYNRSITTDLLTKLPNRTAYFNTVAQEGKRMHFMLIDLIEFRNINTIFGMKVGDFLLTEVAKILRDFAKKSAYCRVFRIGSDEFA
ncbi:MAG: diguanylate cyclase domain-containing protein, partial [Campylobacterota bacterium]